MPLKAIFLGSLGTLADTSELERRAFNAAFAEAGLDWEWSVEDLRRGSGSCAERIARYARQIGVGVDARVLQERKSVFYRGFLDAVAVPPRPGLKSLILATRSAGLHLGLVTTSSPDTVRAMLAVTGLEPSTFDFIGDATLVEAPKPAPDIYLAALDTLELAPSQALAVEESEANAEAARAAGLQCASFPGAARFGSRFVALPAQIATPPDDATGRRAARRA